MTTHTELRAAPGWRIAEWFCGIVGAISVFLGLFILFGSESSSIGIGGDWSWEVGDISSAWGYGLLVGGIVLLLFTVAAVFFAPKTMRRVESNPRSDLLWHTIIFVLVNAFIWIQDIAIGGGVDYAYWITIPWAIGLIAHATAYLVGRSKTPEEPPQPAEPKELQHH